MHTIRKITRLATMLAGLIALRLRLGFVSASISFEHCRSSRNNPHCAPRHVIYYYVTSVRIRVFMRTLESNLVFIMILVHCTSYFVTSLGHFDFIDLVQQQRDVIEHAQFKTTRLFQQGANAVRRIRRLYSAVWLQAHAQFNFYISFLCSGIHQIALLSTVAEKRVFAPEAHKNMFALIQQIQYKIYYFNIKIFNVSIINIFKPNIYID